MDQSLVYMRTQLASSSDEKVIAMLLDRVERALKACVEAIDANDPLKRYQNTTKTLDILTYLAGAVNSDAGGDAAENLGQIYLFCMRQLLQIDLKNDKETAHRLIKVLGPIKEAYRSLADRQRGESSVNNVDQRPSEHTPEGPTDFIS